MEIATGKRRRKCVAEDERLHMFPADYTYHCFNSKRRKVDASAWRDARGSLLGNCFSPGVVAVAVADLLWHLGWLKLPVDLNQLVRHRVRLEPSAERPPAG